MLSYVSRLRARRTIGGLVCLALAFALAAPGVAAPQSPAALAPVPLAALPADAAKAKRYVTEVVDKILKYHPDMKNKTRADVLEGVAEGIAKYLERVRFDNAETKKKLIGFIRHPRGSAGPQPWDSVTRLFHVLNAFSRSYASLDFDKLGDAAAAGAVTTTHDPFSRLLTMQEIQKLQQMMGQGGKDPSFGIAVRRDKKSGKFKVAHVRWGYLGYELGVAPGDEIVSSKGRKLADLTPDEIRGVLQADEGERVTLTIRRAGIDAPIVLAGTQGSTTVPSAVSAMLPGKIGYVRTTMFTMTLHTDTIREIKRLKAQGMKTLILDLRNNPGGAMPACTGLADAFLEPGTLITYTKGTYKPEGMLGMLQNMLGLGGGERQGDRTLFRAKQANPFTMPLALLVNKMSASASEMLSIALKSNKRATIVGTTTYGKGIGQTAIPLSSTGMQRFLYMTVMTYFGPNDEVVHHKGVTPDIVIEAAPVPPATFVKVAKLRQAGTIGKFVASRWEAQRKFFAKQLTHASPLLAYPDIQTLAKDARARAVGPAALARELRRAIRQQTRAHKGKAWFFSVPDDVQLQRAIVAACKGVGQSAGEIDAYKGFANRFGE